MQNKPWRLLPLDALRGLIIVLMALDHANALIARGRLESELWIGPFPDYHGNALAFLVRFVTHLAAPGFFFLMGAGMSLFAASRREQGWGNGSTARHFLVRGALLILFQFTLENPAWQMGQIIPAGLAYFGVLYALGGCMILAILLIRLPIRYLVSLSALLIILTELLLPDAGDAGAHYAPALRLWLLPGFTPGLYVLYPLMPWLGVVGLGLAYGRWLKSDPQEAYRSAWRLGALGLTVFVPLRLMGGFGNLRPPQDNNWIAFLNLVKYPPSLTFLLATLGLDILFLGLFAHLERSFAAPLRLLGVYGGVPLFFYISHLYLYALVGQWLNPAGVGILRMLPFWLFGLALLFPLCWWYGNFKHSRSANSLWRLF
ncbi:MAG: DUF1624 domain-containing protein [Anaerolineales bacterium]|nr:DUF1624 domain-containing protein [Anaerolineales bacterium]